MQIQTLMGICNLTHPLLKKLAQSTSFLRLKNIDMAGPARYFGTSPTPPYSRYQHSVGVCALLQRAKAPLKEQVTGLLHDISHTALSHVGDLVFDHDHSHPGSYQDSIHQEHLNKVEVSELLKEFGLNPDDLIPESGNFPCLEQSLPHLCADRIEYSLHNAVDSELISIRDLQILLNDLHFADGQWFFLSLKTAQLVGNISLQLSKEFWGGEINAVIYHWLSKAIKMAIHSNHLTPHLLKYGQDSEVLEALNKAKNDIEEVNALLMACHQPQNHILRVEEGQHNLVLKPKFRGIDPLYIGQDKRLQLLSRSDPNFAKQFCETKNILQHGIFLKTKNKLFI